MKAVTNMPQNKLQSIIFFTLFFIFSVSIVIFSVVKPTYNWDMIAYAASAKSFENNDKIEVHKYAYDELKKHVSTDVYYYLTNNNDAYEQTLARDPESLAQHLPWYQIRPVYNALVYGLSKTGINVYKATYLVSAVSVFIALWIFYLVFRRRVDALYWYAFPFFIIFNGVIAVSRTGRPDSLAFMWVGVMSWAFMKRHKVLLILLPLAICIRTDLIFLVAPIIGYVFFRFSGWKLASAVSFLASIVIYLLINYYFNNYGWASIFHLVFMTDFNFNYPADAHVTITLQQYLGVLKSSVTRLLSYDEFNVYIAIIVLQLAIIYKGLGLRAGIKHLYKDPLMALSVISFIYVIIHYLIFPDPMARFFVAQYTIGAIAFLATLSNMTPMQQRFHIT